MTRGQFISYALGRLDSSLSPRLDAEMLLMHVCGIDRASVIAHPETDLEARQQDRLHELLTRRSHGEPIAYLTGHREFWSLDFTVTPATLIPRPETELLVERALAHLPTDVSCKLADLGTGCGAIALALAIERPQCRVVATDISTDALAVAHLNAQRHRVANIEFRHGRWFLPLAGERFDMIVSNPPYVRDGDHCLHTGDTRFEDPRALASGFDGLQALREIALGARHCLKPGGRLLLEHGANQVQDLRPVLHDGGYRDIVCHVDLNGIDRVTECRYVA